MSIIQHGGHLAVFTRSARSEERNREEEKAAQLGQKSNAIDNASLPSCHARMHGKCLSVRCPSNTNWWQALFQNHWWLLSCWSGWQFLWLIFLQELLDQLVWLTTQMIGFRGESIRTILTLNSYGILTSYQWLVSGWFIHAPSGVSNSQLGFVSFYCEFGCFSLQIESDI